MKKIGILGGIMWPSTVEYYAGICRLAETRHVTAGLPGIAPMPEIVIESLDVARAVATLGDDADEPSWAAFDAYHRDALLRLHRNGADFAVIACNTAHHRLAQIMHGLDLPVLDIADAVAAACIRAGVRRVLILGTPQVMQSAHFREAFARHGVEAAGLRDAQARRRLAATIQSLQAGRSAGAARSIRTIIAACGAGRLRGPTAVYLGCTELPLAFPEHKRAGVFESDGIRYINSTALHIHATFEYALDTR